MVLLPTSSAIAEPTVPQAALQLEGPFRFPTGPGPRGVATGDFDEDGLVDLVSTNGMIGGTTGGVSILFGLGAGRFDRPVLVAGSQLEYPEDVVVADLDSDGNSDLAVSNGFESDPEFDGVVVLLGRGDGSFRAPVPYPTHNWAGELLAADFNDDGALDVAVGRKFSGDLSILLGDGRGGFGPPTTYPTNGEQRGFDVGDVDGDGVLDLAIANSDELSSFVAVFLGDGSGGFGLAAEIELDTIYTGDLALADFTDDGRLDMAVITYTLGTQFDTVLLLIGDGSGGFVERRDFHVVQNTRFLDAVDFNGDRIADLVLTSGIPGSYGTARVPRTVSIAIGDGHGGFLDPVITELLGRNPTEPAIADLDRNGTLDLALGTSESRDYRPPALNVLYQRP